MLLANRTTLIVGAMAVAAVLFIAGVPTLSPTASRAPTRSPDALHVSADGPAGAPCPARAGCVANGPVPTGSYWVDGTFLSKARPSARCCAAIAYDPVEQVTILFGGASSNRSNASPMGDTWAFSAGLWTNLTSRLGVAPPARYHASFEFDSSDGYLLLFGGVGCGTGRNLTCNDTWTFVHGLWRSVGPRNAPAPRAEAAMTDDPTDHAVMLFGGVTDPQNNSTVRRDTWSYRAGNWTNLTPFLAPSPAAARGAGFAFDRTDNYTVLFGGNLAGQTWSYAAGGWTRLSEPVSPPARWYPALTFDPTVGGLLLFGGAPGPTRLFHDTWVFHQGNWTSLTPSLKIHPSGRSNFGLVWDGADNYTLLWGGLVSAASIGPPVVANDSWVFGPPVVASLRTSAPAIDLGQSLRIVARAVSLTRTVAYNFSSLPPGCLPPTGNQSFVTCTPYAIGTFSLGVRASDLAGHSTVANASLVVNPTFALHELRAESGDVDVGHAVNFSVNWSGGTGPFVFSYLGLPSGCVSEDAPTLVCWPNSSGTSEVVVNSTDATGVTHSASVAVTVHPELRIGVVTVRPPAIDLGQIAQFSSSASGGAAPYRYQFSGAPPGCSAPSSGVSSFDCRPNATGTYVVGVVASDTTGARLNGTGTLHVVPDPQLLLQGPPTRAADHGQTSVFGFSMTGGIPPYAFGNLRLPVGCAASFPSVVCEINVTETVSIDVIGVDAVGFPSSVTVTLAVQPLPRIVNASVTPASSDVGVPIVISVGVVGGTGPLRYAYASLPGGCLAVNASQLHCTPDTAASYTVLATVVDAAGASDSTSLALDVNPDPFLQQARGAVESVILGHPLYLEVVPFGGTGPFAYRYLGLPAGCGSVDSPALNCTPQLAGTYSVRVVATDASFVNASANFTVQVLAPPAVPSAMVWPLWALYALGGLLVVVVVLGALAIHRVGRERRPPPH